MMEEMNENVTAQEGRQEESSLLVRNYESLRSVMLKKMADYFKEEDSSITVYGSYAEAVFRIKGQCMAEDMADELVEQLGVNILYAATTHYGKYWEVVLYARPIRDEMYVILLSSCQHGVIDEVSVVLYESYEPMFALLTTKLVEVEQKNANIMEKVAPEELHRHFFK